MQRQNPLASRSLPSDTIANPRGDVKAITTRSGVAYEGPSIPPTSSFLPKEVERKLEVTKVNVQTTSSESTAHVQPLVVQVPILEPERLHFDISFADALLYMLKFASTFMSLLIDYDVDHHVPLILGRRFLRMTRALIDVHDEELTLQVNYEAITSTSGNPTPLNPIIASPSLSFTPFEGGDFILEEIDTFPCTPDELSKLDDDYYDTEGDILYLEKLLNEDPSLNLPPMKNEDLKQADVTMTKPSIEEPPELKLKDVPSYLEYAFLEGTDKLPVIISK
nr:reverse transcriptase domain-containing protein [Tanacetum cinerariifolium]